MTPGSVFLDKQFAYHDGESGEKLFLVLGTVGLLSVVAKTTSRQHGRGTVYGCQPFDRFHNFYLPLKSCYFKKDTWICLNEFYELQAAQMIKKGLAGSIHKICTLDPHFRAIQECALESIDMTPTQAAIVKACITA